MFSINFYPNHMYNSLYFNSLKYFQITSKETFKLHTIYLFKYFFRYSTLFAISSFPNIFKMIYKSGVFVLVVAITRIIVATSPTCPKQFSGFSLYSFTSLAYPKFSCKLFYSIKPLFFFYFFIIYFQISFYNSYYSCFFFIC